MAIVNFSGINMPARKMYERPIDELNEILQKYLYQMQTPQLIHGMESEINHFTESIAYDYNLRGIERDAFNINFRGGYSDHVIITPSNLFSACILFGKYVPYYFVEDKYIITFLDGDVVSFEETGVYSLRIKYFVEHMKGRDRHGPRIKMRY